MTLDQTTFAATLRAWRDRLSPATAGLPMRHGRRAQGLRREELAELAGVSVDYVVRLEQGRATTPSAQVVAALNRTRRDAWPPYEPTRHVLVKRTDHRYARPWQGFVVDWRRDGRTWTALVVFVDERQDGSPVVQCWLPADRLRPCHPDPNPQRDAWF